MELPILDKLKDGVTFDFATLVDNIEQTYDFWDWWWKERYEEGEISRPEIINPDDPILTQTEDKTTVNLASYAELFDHFLLNYISQGRLPGRDCLPRNSFREQLQRIVGANSIKLPDRPQLVFAGGGYGSGKTTILNRLAKCGVLPIEQCYHIGVDVFKNLVPEYNLIKAVGDGRASFTVQKECTALAKGLFERLIAEERSFIFDSSMSNQPETTGRILAAQAAGYELTMVAVLTPLTLAKKQAMDRAMDSRRFPHPGALPESHVGFRQAFMGYVPHFDSVKVFARLDGNTDAILVAEKDTTKELVISDDNLFNRALCG